MRKCDQCKGTGQEYVRILNLGTREYEHHIVACGHIACKNGLHDPEIWKAEVKSILNWGKK